MRSDDEELAVVYLKKNGDRRNRIYFTKTHFAIIFKSKPNAYRLEDLKSVRITRHNLLLPIVAGGTIASFSIIAIFFADYHPLYTVSTFLAGCLILFWGFAGEDVLEIDIKVKLEIFPLKVTDNLKAFLHFFNHYFTAAGQSEKWYIYIPVQQYPVEDLYYEQYPVKAYTYEQMMLQKAENEQKNDKSFVALNPFLLRSEIKFFRDPDNKTLHPMIFGSINVEAVVSGM